MYRRVYRYINTVPLPRNNWLVGTAAFVLELAWLSRPNVSVCLFASMFVRGSTLRVCVQIAQICVPWQFYDRKKPPWPRQQYVPLYTRREKKGGRRETELFMY